MSGCGFRRVHQDNALHTAMSHFELAPGLDCGPCLLGKRLHARDWGPSGAFCALPPSALSIDYERRCSGDTQAVPWDARSRRCSSVKKILELTEHITIGEIPEAETVDFDVEAWDDVTGKALDPKTVRQARLKEMKYVKEKEVWEPISRDEARRRGWKVVKTKWIDINKGDADTPNYRSRLVSKEFTDGAGEGLFASTPPLE